MGGASKHTQKKKYEFTGETTTIEIEGVERTLHRIRALKDFGNVLKGQEGGWIESEKNLSQDGTAWVGDEAMACENARVYQDGQLSGFALACGHAQVSGGLVSDQAQISDHVQVFENAIVVGQSLLYGNACLYGAALVTDNAFIEGPKSVFWVKDAPIRGDTATFFLCNDGKIRVHTNGWMRTLSKAAKHVNALRNRGVYSDRTSVIRMLNSIKLASGLLDPDNVDTVEYTAQTPEVSIQQQEQRQQYVQDRLEQLMREELPTREQPLRLPILPTGPLVENGRQSLRMQNPSSRDISLPPIRTLH